MEPQSEHLRKEYVLGYTYPKGSNNFCMLRINSTNLKDAFRTAKCLFGDKASKHLFFRYTKVKIKKK
jgi:hypothetical protein